MIFKKFFLRVIFLSLFSLVFAGPKEFKRNYEGVSSIQAVIHTHEGQIILDLNFREAPNTVANFIDLSQKGFYKGLVFHRIIQGFMVQAGDPLGTGAGGPGYTIADEVNHLKHEVGVISMANRGPNTGGSQFFITQMPQPHLDGKHTVFGRVIQGQDVICLLEPNDPIIDIEIVEDK